MSTYSTRLIGSEMIANRTMAFHFEKPAGFAFRGGQAIDLALPTLQEGGQAARHAFSLVSAPHEARLTIATRMRDSPYKEGLLALAPGTSVQVDGPFGSLILHKDSSRDAIMIAGGIGITPFVSILRQAIHERQERRLVLVYSNRRADDTAYLDELLSMARDFPKLSIIPTWTQAGAVPIAWTGRTGRIDGALLTGIPAS